jgi:hypothetical protein
VLVCEGPAGVDEVAEPTGVVEGEGPTELALEATPSVLVCEGHDGPEPVHDGDGPVELALEAPTPFVLVCEGPADVDEGAGPAEGDEADGPADTDEADGPGRVDEPAEPAGVDGPVELALEAPIPSVLVCEGVAELPTGTEAV